MARSPYYKFFNQIVLALWILTVTSMSLVIASALLFLGDLKTGERPGFNIKEF